jgi:hypothetical protein
VYGQRSLYGNPSRQHHHARRPRAPLEGQRVRVIIALADNDVELAPEQQAEAWRQWAASGPQGPIEDDGDPELP